MSHVTGPDAVIISRCIETLCTGSSPGGGGGGGEERMQLSGLQTRITNIDIPVPEGPRFYGSIRWWISDSVNSLIEFVVFLVTLQSFATYSGYGR